MITSSTFIKLVLDFAIGFLFTYTSLRGASWIEKRFIDKKAIESRGKVIERKTTQFFRHIRWIVILSVSVESAIKAINLGVFPLISGLSLFFIGFLLRITAIRTLGEFWSYHVEVKPNQRIINEGIYKYIKHPAYLGNIYIVGICLMVSCYFSAIVASALLIIFGYKRLSLEEEVLKYIDDKTQIKNFT